MLALEAKEARCSSVSSSSAGTSIQGSHWSWSRVKAAGRVRPLAVVPPCWAARPRVRGGAGGRVGGGDLESVQHGEARDQALQVALEGDQLADQHDGAGVVARSGQLLLLGEGRERRGDRQQVHLVAQRGERGIVGERIRGEQLRGGTLGAVPLGEHPAALPVRAHGGEGMEHGGGQHLGFAIERVVGVSGACEHVRAQRGQCLARLGRSAQERGEDLRGVEGRLRTGHAAILCTPKA